MTTAGKALVRARNWLHTMRRGSRGFGTSIDGFDADFYQLERGESFDTSEDAFKDFMERGDVKKFSPHPALPYSVIPRSVRRAWSKGDVGTLVRYLSTHAVRDMVPLDDEQRKRVLETVVSCTQGRSRSELTIREDWATWPAGDTLTASIIIPTFNDFRMTVACVRSIIQRTARDDYEVIVVDNGSEAHISHALAALLSNDPRVHLLRLPSNANFAGGSNTGALAASGDHLVFLNNDTEVNPGWLEALLEPLASPEILGTQSLLLYPDGRIQTAGTVFVRDGLLPCHLLAGQEIPDSLGSIEKWHFRALSAACLALRACDFYSIEGFDTGYENGFEDVDLCLRLKAQAPSTAAFHVASRSRVTHLESKSPGRFNRVDQNRERFVRLWGPCLTATDEEVFALTDYRVVDILTDDRPVPAAKPVLARLGSHTPTRVDKS